MLEKKKSHLLVQPRKHAYLENMRIYGKILPIQDSVLLPIPRLSPHCHFSATAISPLPPTTANSHPKKTAAYLQQIQLLVNRKWGQEIQPELLLVPWASQVGERWHVAIKCIKCVYGGSAVQKMEQWPCNCVLLIPIFF